MHRMKARAAGSRVGPRRMYVSFPWFFFASATIKGNNTGEIRFSEGSSISIEAILICLDSLLLASRDARSELNYSESNHFSPRADVHVVPANLSANNGMEIRNAPLAESRGSRNECTASPILPFIFHARVPWIRLLDFQEHVYFFLG